MIKCFGNMKSILIYLYILIKCRSDCCVLFLFFFFSWNIQYSTSAALTYWILIFKLIKYHLYFSWLWKENHNSNPKTHLKCNFHMRCVLIANMVSFFNVAVIFERIWKVFFFYRCFFPITKTGFYKLESYHWDFENGKRYKDR